MFNKEDFKDLHELEIIKDTSEYEVEELSQYYFDRGEWTKAFVKQFDPDRGEYFDFYDAIGESWTGFRFHIWRDEDEYYVCDMRTGMVVNWYKHEGRTNTCSQRDRTLADLQEFFRLLKLDLVEHHPDFKKYTVK